MADVVEYVDGVRVERAFTGKEKAQHDADVARSAAAGADRQRADAIRATLTTRAANALTANRDFLALSSPTNAQTVAQVKALTRQNTGLIRLLLGLLDDTD